jgi:hypothetical protein
MKATKLRNHPLPTHQQLLEEQEEKMERLEEGYPDNAAIDDEDVAEQTGDDEQIERIETLKG